MSTTSINGSPNGTANGTPNGSTVLDPTPGDVAPESAPPESAAPEPATGIRGRFRESAALQTVRSGARDLNQRLADERAPLLLTLFLVVLATSDAWYVAVPVIILAVTGLVQPKLADAPKYWLILAAVLGANAVAGRWQVDNHQYLIAYWCLALALAAASPDPATVRRIAARVLIAAVFVLAAVWKILSPDFVDGSFMRYTMLTDSRFSEVAALVGGVEPPALEANRAAVKQMANPDAPLAPVPLQGSARIDTLATLLTWWTLLIEGGVALAFALPGRLTRRYRDALLLTFIITTYAIAPVVGFGWVLVCLGLAQRERSRRWLPLAYLTAFLLVQAFTAPWTSIAGLMP